MKKMIILSLAAFLLSSFMMVGSVSAATPSSPGSVSAVQTHHKKWHKKWHKKHKKWHKKWHKKHKG